MGAVEAKLEMVSLRRRLEEVANPERAQAMETYLRDQFPCLGVAAADRRVATRPTLEVSKGVTTDELMAFAMACWGEREREFAYVACGALRADVARIHAEHLDDLRTLITTRSWWETVDPLATRVVGPMITAHPELIAGMDHWVRSDDIWLARTAILHQLMYGEDTDPVRLFTYARLRAGDTEFFIRKAIGWALRQYGRIDPGAVRRFVSIHERELSGLTRREALKHLG